MLGYPFFRDKREIERKNGIRKQTRSYFDVSTSQLSVITERASETAADLQIRIRALHASNIGAASTVTGHTAVVSTVGGIKLAG